MLSVSSFLSLCSAGTIRSEVSPTLGFLPILLQGSGPPQGPGRLQVTSPALHSLPQGITWGWENITSFHAFSKEEIPLFPLMGQGDSGGSHRLPEVQGLI